MNTKEREFFLILDDDPDITEALAVALEAEGRTVITCSDLPAAQLLVERLPVSVVLTDVRLSGPFAFEGLELIQHVRKYSPGTKIILMTGTSSDGLQVEAFKRGACGFLQKPFDLAELEQLIEAYG